VTREVAGWRGRDSNPSSGIGQVFKREATLHTNALKLAGVGALGAAASVAAGAGAGVSCGFALPLFL